MPQLTTTIYALIDPITNQIRYVGRANNVKHRYKNHLNSCKDKGTHKRNWINKLKRLGYKPELLILDEVDINEWNYWERFWIAYYKHLGYKLLNYTNGGDGTKYGNQTSFKKGDIPWNKGIACSKDTKEKISKTLIGIPTGRVRKVVQYDMDNNLLKIYESMSDACCNGKFNISKICACCTNTIKQHKKYKWKYYEDHIKQN